MGSVQAHLKVNRLYLNDLHGYDDVLIHMKLEACFHFLLLLKNKNNKINNLIFFHDKGIIFFVKKRIYQNYYVNINEKL